MERLIELAKLVTKEKTKKVNIIGQENSKKDSLTKRLYEAILMGKVNSDEEAGMLLYGDDYDKNTYIRTKYRLEEKLINSLFFINFNEAHYSDFQKNYYKCHKDAAAVKFLMGKSARNIGIALAEKTIRQAIKYEFTEIILDLGRILKSHYRIYNSNKEKANFYIQLVNYHKKVLEIEILGEDFQQAISSQTSPSRASQSALKEEVIKYELILRNHLKKYTSYKIKLKYYSIAILRYKVVNDNKEVIRVCQEGLKHFDNISDKKSTGPIIVFCIDIILSCISLKDYNLGVQMFRKVLNITPEGGLNWFISMECYILLCFHTKNYHEAFSVLVNAISNKKYAQLPKQYMEMWKVYDAYCHFLIESKQLVIAGRKSKKFKLAKFLNEVPQYSKDKLGINISILIIQVLFLLNRKKRDAIIERVDALTQYAYRYLIKDETLRSNCFIKMLAKMVKANFHKNATMRTSQKLLTRLKTTPLTTKGQSQFVEIIPYEILWNMVISKLINRAI